MIKLLRKPDNVALKGDGSSIYSELEGVTICDIDFDYYNFRKRDCMFDANAGGCVYIFLENKDYWAFEVRGIDVSTVVKLQDAFFALTEMIPTQYKDLFKFQWKRFFNSERRPREYSMVTYELSPIMYSFVKYKDVIIEADDHLHRIYFRISTNI